MFSTPWGAVEPESVYGWELFSITVPITNDWLVGVCKAAASHGLPG